MGRTKGNPEEVNSVAVVVSLTPALVEQARDLAKAENRSLSGLLRYLLAQRLARRAAQRRA